MFSNAHEQNQKVKQLYQEKNQTFKIWMFKIFMKMRYIIITSRRKVSEGIKGDLLQERAE